MNAGRTSLLRDARDAHFDVRRSGLHEVGQLVDEHHDVWKTIGNFLLFDLHFLFILLGHQVAGLERRGNLLDCLFVDFFLLFLRVKLQFLLNRRRFIRPHAVVESIEIADPFLGKDPIAFLHFVHHPLERGDGFFRVGHHRHDEVREAVVHLHFDHLRVDHDEAKFVGAEFEKHRGNDRVDAHRLARAGRARDEQMRHGCQIADDRAAIDILAERERDFLLRRAKLRIVQQLAQRHGDLLAVSNFDADRVLARDRREDVDPFRAGGAREVGLKLRNP